MSEKPKNKDKTEAKGLSCLQKIAIAIIVTLTIPVLILIFMTLHVLYLEWRDGQFMITEQSNVQTAIREQCAINDYLLSGWWNDSDTPPSYYDLEESGIQRIDCAYKNDSWHCTCDKAD